MNRRFLISNSIEDEKLDVSDNTEIIYGKAHYSWKVIAKLYRSGLTNAGMYVEMITRPEIYQTELAWKVKGIRYGDVHLAVKPVEHIRPFYGIKNVFICGWEFPEFTACITDDNPLEDQIHILSKADEVWCWSSFAANNLKAYGINQAKYFPPPVITESSKTKSYDVLKIPAYPLDNTKPPDWEDIGRLEDFVAPSSEQKIFFSVLNPFDKRKQFAMMIEEFQSVAVDNNIVLIIKLIIDNEQTKLVHIQDILKSHYLLTAECPKIIFIGDELTSEQLNALYDMANFYLCTSSTEGLNLPLIEAMSMGCVPVSSRETAMKDYVFQSNAIVISVKQQRTGTGYHVFGEDLKTTHFPPVQGAVKNAVIKAIKLTPRQYQTKSDRAKKTVWSKYSLNTFKKAILKWGRNS